MYEIIWNGFDKSRSEVNRFSSAKRLVVLLYESTACNNRNDKMFTKIETHWNSFQNTSRMWLLFYCSIYYSSEKETAHLTFSRLNLQLFALDSNQLEIFLSNTLCVRNQHISNQYCWRNPLIFSKRFEFIFDLSVSFTIAWESNKFNDFTIIKKIKKHQKPARSRKETHELISNIVMLRFECIIMP